MQFRMLKLYRPVNEIIIPQTPLSGKNVCLAFIGENVTFRDTYRYLRIKISSVRHIFVPKIIGPAGMFLSTSYRKVLKSHHLVPVTGPFGDYSAFLDHNFFVDYDTAFSRILLRYNLKNYQAGMTLQRVLPLLNTLTGVPEDQFERVLLYAVSIDNQISPIIMKRKFFLIYKLLVQWFKDPKNTRLPFDKVLMFVYDSASPGRYVLVFDKNAKNNQLGRLKSILTSMRMAEFEDEQQMEIQDSSEEIANNSEIMQDLSVEDKILAKNVVKNFITSDPNLTGFSNGVSPKQLSPGLDSSKTPEAQKEKNKILTAAFLGHTIGDPHKAMAIAEKLKDASPEKQKRVIDKAKVYVLPKQESHSASRDPIVTMSGTEKITDNINPSHLLEKRKRDFNETLLEDLSDAFKVLKNKPLPLTLDSIKIKTITSSPSELKTTIKDRYSVSMTDYEGNKHDISVELPHLTENGAFLVNGQKKIIFNQLVVYPIFFFKPYSGKFSSSYSTVTVYSKILRKGSYLNLYMCGCKVPLVMYMSYRLGFAEAMKKYGVEYQVTTEKVENSIPIPGKKFITFKYKDTVGEQYVASFLYSMSSFPQEKFDIEDQKTWKTVLETHVGNRNCTYLMNQVWQNVVTPIEIRLLDSRGDPTNISDIVRYIAGEVVQGRVDDRNGLDKQRVRTSEIFISLLQKQILAAYNEYESKREAGDTSARLYINSTKVFSEVINSQNVQSLENVNPLEELAMMTRVSPIGVGGIPDVEAYPTRALNIHDTYYGNIDPLETPDGGGVGVQQQLAMGANITNVRGTFMMKPRDQVNPTEILSTTPAMIPFVESNEGTRVTMASGQAKQAVSLQNPQIPCIQSGYESILVPFLSDNFIKKSPVDGVIKEITDLVIIIQDSATGKDIAVDVSPITLKSGQGKNGLGLFNTVVKVGDKVKKDRIISEGSNIKDGLISNGLNMMVAFMPWKGYNFEDGMVISESAAKRFVSLHVEEEVVYLEEEEEVLFIAPIGTEVEKGAILLTYSSAAYDVESHKHLRADGGKVVNVEIYSNIPEEQIPPALFPVYEDFKKRFTVLHGVYPIGQFKEKDEKFKGILIKFTLQQALSLTKGDKLNNRHFNKGVVSIIEQDANMPVSPWGDRIDMIYNPLGIINRMITGQILEMHCGLISKNLSNRIQKEPRNQFMSLLIPLMDLLDGTPTKTYSKNLIKHMTSLSDKAWDGLVAKIGKDGFFPLIFAPFKSPERNNIEKALTLCGLKPRYPLFVPEYNFKTDPVSVGYVYVMKLEHMSEKKIHARGVGPYVEQTMAPTGGKKRGGGQQLGEYDMYSLLSWDCPTMVDEFFGPASSDHATKNEMISEIIQGGETTHKEAKSNPVKDLFIHTMLAIHLSSD